MRGKNLNVVAVKDSIGELKELFKQNTVKRKTKDIIQEPLVAYNGKFYMVKNDNGMFNVSIYNSKRAFKLDSGYLDNTGRYGDRGKAISAAKRLIDRMS